MTRVTCNGKKYEFRCPICDGREVIESTPSVSKWVHNDIDVCEGGFTVSDSSEFTTEVIEDADTEYKCSSCNFKLPGDGLSEIAEYIVQQNNIEEESNGKNK